MTAPPLILDRLAGPPLPSGSSQLEVLADRPAIVGRSSGVDVQLLDPTATLSRRHLRIECSDSRWQVVDLGSRHGTYLEGARLEPERPAPLRPGDHLRLGPWTFRVRSDSPSRGAVTTMEDFLDRPQRVEAIPDFELRRLAQDRLDALLDCSAQLNAAADLAALASIVTAAVVRGTGCPRAVLVRSTGDDTQLELIGHSGPPGESTQNLRVSRSLVAAAQEGRIVRLSGDAPLPAQGQSIVSLGIDFAICAPVRVGDAIEAFLYVDARSDERRVEHDAAAFCQAIARMCGLAMANLRRQELEEHWRDMERDLEAARQAQRIIMPPASGRVGRVRYELESRPGRMVAGDLFDVVRIDDNRVAVFLGDVTGKGVGAAMTMAMVQTHLRVALRREHDPGALMHEANAFLVNRLPPGKFVTLWLGIVDAAAGVLHFVDAGHGLGLLRAPGAPVCLIESEGGLPLGVESGTPAAELATERVAFPPGSRLLLLSDGAVEQQDREGVAFGLEGVTAAVAKARDARDDVHALTAAVVAHAGTEQLADDLTIAAIELVE